MDISQKLQTLLQATSTSRSKLARALGVHTSTVTNWLDGKQPKLEHVAAAARYFGVTTDYLTGSAPAGKAPQAAAESTLAGVYLQLAKEMQKEAIHPDDIRFFIEMQKRARRRHEKS
ncbi:MAG: helix-turn-helix domain-containing protein [Oscillospiraceae bacterium]